MGSAPTDVLKSLLPLIEKDSVVKAYTYKIGEMGREITNVEVDELKRFCESKEAREDEAEAKEDEARLKREIYGKGSEK